MNERKVEERMRYFEHVKSIKALNKVLSLKLYLLNIQTEKHTIEVGCT